MAATLYFPIGNNIRIKASNPTLNGTADITGTFSYVLKNPAGATISSGSMPYSSAYEAYTAVIPSADFSTQVVGTSGTLTISESGDPGQWGALTAKFSLRGLT